jgi:hypothetical protein
MARKKKEPTPATPAPESAPIATLADAMPPIEGQAPAPAATVTPPRPPKKSEEKLRVQYTDAELLEIGKKLAETARAKEALEDEKKSITKDFGSRLDGLAARISELSNNLSCGFNYRDVTVETTYGEPGPGKKTTRRLDTGAILRVEAMTLAEMQSELPLKADADADDDGDAITVETVKPAADPTPRVQPATSPEGVVTVEADDDIFKDTDTNNP